MKNYRVRSKEEIERILKESGFVLNYGDWRFEDCYFLISMLDYCEKAVLVKEILVKETTKPYDYIMEEPPYYSFKKEWLEEVEEEAFKVTSDTREMKVQTNPETTIELTEEEKVMLNIKPTSDYTTKHYDFKYYLTEEDISRGYIKLDPYFVGNEWKLGEKDPSGILGHDLKTIARFGDKNSKRRESEALIKQSENLLRFY